MKERDKVKGWICFSCSLFPEAYALALFYTFPNSEKSPVRARARPPSSLSPPYS